jgi:hypothetical protein
MFNKNRQGTSNRKKDGCKKGHSFEEFEPLVYVKKQGRQIGKEYRVCKECKREYRLKNKEKQNERQRNLYHARKNKQNP